MFARETGLANYAEMRASGGPAKLTSAAEYLTYAPNTAARAQEGVSREIIRTADLEILSRHPADTAGRIQALATELGGFVLNSNLSGGGESQSAEVRFRVPASRFDDARGQVRQLASTVQRENTQAQDVTREYADQQAKLRNLRAEEAQFLALLKRASSIKDMADVTEKLNDVRGEIDSVEGDLRYMKAQVDMSLITVHVYPEPTVGAFRWRPLYQAGRSLRGAISSLTDYADSMVAFLMYIPLILLWILTAFVVIKLGWVLVRRLGRVFFPRARMFTKPAPQAASD
jgi:hypothetical protein